MGEAGKRPVPQLCGITFHIINPFTPMFKLALRYGLISSLLASSITLIYYLISKDQPFNYGRNEVVGYSTIVVSSLVIVVGQLAWRRRTYAPRLVSLFGVGMAINAIGAAFFSLFLWVVMALLRPDMLPAMMAAYEAKIRREAASPQALEKALADLQNSSAMFLNPAFQAVIMFFTVMLIGMVVALAGAAVISRRPIAANAS